MKSISTKLFLTLLSFTVMVLFATLLLARWSFDYGFLDYLNAQQQQRLNKMADDLSMHYEENAGSWSKITQKEYRKIYRKWFLSPVGRRSQVLRSSFKQQPDADPSFSYDRLPLRRGGDKAGQNGESFKEPIVVLDSEGDYLVGHKGSFDDKAILFARIKYKNQTIGSVKAVKQIKFSSGVESTFSKQQTKASLIIAILCLLVAGLASWWLSRMLLAPTYKMKDAIGGLVKGDFSNRLDVDRSDELGQLMLDINRLSKTLKQNHLSRKRWIADISHELRTPVAILSGELEAVMDGIRPLNKKAIESLSHEVSRLKYLVDDLYQLSLSDIGGLRYDFNSLNVSELLEEVVGRNAARIKDAGITLSLNVTEKIIIEADPARLEQLFTNLINNSISYTDAPGVFDIKLRLNNEYKYAVIYFNDSSPGVEVEQLEEIFEPLFRQDSSRSRRKAGAGLGLTISQNIVKGHGGRIKVKASKLGGLEFVVALPIKRK